MQAVYMDSKKETKSYVCTDVWLSRGCRALLQIVSKEAPSGIPDMIQLDILHEGAIQDNIYRRYQRDEIYTFVGSLLISVNPYKSLDIYSPEYLGRFVQDVKRSGLSAAQVSSTCKA